MPTIMTSTVLHAPATTVWPVLRDFAAITSWHPYLSECRIENGPADRVGCTRVFPTYGDHRETLTGLDDHARMIGYAFDDNAGLPVRDYRCTMRITEVTVAGHTLVRWEARFDCDAADEPQVVAQVREFLEAGLAALTERYRPAMVR